jgi:hypothetical protein
MAYFIFLKYLRSLEEFRKNPCLQIPPKSPSTNFQTLGKFKNPIFNPKILLPIHFSLLARLALPAHLAFGPACPTRLPSPVGQSLPHRPIRPMCRWRLRRNMFSFLVRAFRAGRVLSRLSLSSGPRLSAPSPTPRRLTPAAPPSSSVDRMASSCLNSPAIKTPSLTLPLTSPSSMALKTLTPPLPPGHPSPACPSTYKR